MEKRLSLSVCFQLGRALRYSDADAFLTLYDSLLRDGRVEQDQQLLAVKEWSRQISELNQDDFTLLHTAAAATLSGPLSNTCDVSIATNVECAVCEQLCCLVDRLRSVEATTSDSGAVSDYSENTDCKSHSLSSLQDYLGESEGNQQDGGKTTLEDVKNNNTLQGASSLESNFSNTRAATEGSIDLPGKLTQPKEEVLGEELPATENTSSDLESSQPSLGVTECGKPTGNQTLSSDSTTENSGERLDEVAKEKVENKREVAPDEQIRIKRKSKRFSGRGYNNWRTCYGYYDNNRNRNSYHDKSRSRGQQYTSSSKDRKVHKPSPFNHEEVAAFLWNRWKSVEKASRHNYSVSHNKS